MSTTLITIPRLALMVVVFGAFCAGFALAGSFMIDGMPSWMFWLDIALVAGWAVLTGALFRMLE